MYKKKKILAVVLARSKSKSIKDKNIKKIKQIPLIGYAGLLLNKIKLIDSKIISTDSDKYGKIGKKYGLDYIFKRPSALSGSRVSDYKVLKHALILAEKIYQKKFDIIISIPPTSPLRKKSNFKLTFPISK